MQETPRRLWQRQCRQSCAIRLIRNVRSAKGAFGSASGSSVSMPPRAWALLRRSAARICRCWPMRAHVRENAQATSRILLLCGHRAALPEAAGASRPLHPARGLCGFRRPRSSLSRSFGAAVPVRTRFISPGSYPKTTGTGIFFIGGRCLRSDRVAQPLSPWRCECGDGPWPLKYRDGRRPPPA